MKMSISNQVVSQYEEPVADIRIDIENRNIYGIDIFNFFIFISFGLITIAYYPSIDYRMGLEVSCNPVLYIMFQ